MRFTYSLQVGRPRVEVWNFLWDVDRLKDCIPGCRSIEAVEPRRRYRALLEEQVGPFKVSFGADVTVSVVEEGSELEMTLAAEDRRVLSSLRMTMRCRLGDVEAAGGEAGGARMDVETEVEVRGRLATVGQGLIRRKADAIVGEFVERLRGQLEPGQPDGGADKTGAAKL